MMYVPELPPHIWDTRQSTIYSSRVTEAVSLVHSKHDK